MCEPPKPITVIIPCFNDGETLDDAVQSAIAANVTEIVIVNDGSTDAGTKIVLQHYAAGGITVLDTENSGVAAARSYALDRVKTPYVFNLDADDALISGGLGRLYGALCDDPTCQVAWGDYCVFGYSEYVVETARCIDAWQLTLVNDLPVSALFRTEALRRAGGWQAEGYEDWDLWMSFAALGFRGTHEAVTVFRYRTSPRAVRRRNQDQLRHGALLAQLRRRHPILFERRARAWRKSRVPWRVRLVLPLVSALPLSDFRRTWTLWRVNQVISHGRVRAAGGARR
jgi:glycosyltransferase involved in cell wall biosynthesis